MKPLIQTKKKHIDTSQFHILEAIIIYIEIKPIIHHTFYQQLKLEYESNP